MKTITQKEKNIDIREKLSIDLCDNFIKRLNPAQSKETKIGALIAIRNFIKESKIDDPFLFSYLVDTIADPSKEIRNIVIKVIKEISNPEIIELLEIKKQEVSQEIKTEINNLLQF
ncbi:MAG: HEAT repeat domain-containing protein [Candidatus Melainabacteria bacterium]|nr:HEAT repeat domain-containing protein [Candidatus Melainabacteria bacterium]